MAYCEAAQKECLYLDVLERAKGDATAMRATAQNSAEARLASNVEAGVEKVAEITEACQQDYCGLIGLAVSRAVLEQADMEGRKL
jgi:hypothetical protein